MFTIFCHFFGLVSLVQKDELVRYKAAAHLKY